MPRPPTLKKNPLCGHALNHNAWPYRGIFPVGDHNCQLWLKDVGPLVDCKVAHTCFSSHAKQTLANYYSKKNAENVYYYLDLLRINYCQNHSINWGKNNYSTFMTNSVHISVYSACKLGNFTKTGPKFFIILMIPKPCSTH